MQSSILELVNVSKIFTSGGVQKMIVRDACFSVGFGEIVAFVGRSGIGKSTVLQICGLLDHASSGEVLVCGNVCKGENFITDVRRKNIGFIYQFHYLLTEFSVVENIMIPLILNGYDGKSSRVKSMQLLERMSLEKLADSSIFELSGGEKQRIAIARSIVHEPKIVIADEPTGNLDPNSAEMVFSLLVEFAKINKSAVLIATHNMELAKRADYVITIDNGKIVKIHL